MIRIKANKRIKIFMGMTEIAGYFTRLSDAFQELGVENYFVDIGNNSDNYKKKHKMFTNNIIIKLRKSYSALVLEKNVRHKNVSKIKMGIYMILLFVWAITKANTFIFIYGNTFFSRIPLLKHLDLKLLKALNKVIIFVYVGSDSRALYSSAAINYMNASEIVKKTKKQSKEIKNIERYASYIVDNPASSHFHTKKFINTFNIGMPIDEFVSTDLIKTKASTTLTILHAPSNPEIKGTEIIRHEISRLKKKGHEFMYVELTGMPNSVIRENLDNCDFVIDELYSDCPLAGFSTEAALAGKAAVIGGYAKGFLEKVISEENMPTSFYSDPKEIEGMVEKLIIGEKAREEAGEKAKSFVKFNWESKIVAQKYLKIINNKFPESWYYDPYECDYIYGCGVSKEKIKATVTQIVGEYGIEALCLDDKQKLIDNYIGLIDS
jgi:hypothetical protein